MKQASSKQQPQILCLLFSDVKDYSSLRDDDLKNRIAQEMLAIVERNRASGVQLIKAMGDGLMICSFTPLPLAELALRLRDTFRTTDWKAEGFPNDFLIRIGLHVAEMIVHYRDDGSISDVIGAGVDATARIEPVTEPNAVFCSAQFYNMLQATGKGKIKGISQGKKELAKQYGQMELYELRWTHEVATAEAAISQQSVAPVIPMPKIKKAFTDKDRRDFLRDAFGKIKSYFDEAVRQLQISAPTIEATVTSISATKFTTEIYRNGQLQSRCKIWIGHLMHSSEEIYYSEGRFEIDSDNSMNDSIRIEDDGQKMYLRSTIGPMFSVRGPDTRNPSTPQQVAESLWVRFTQYLEH